MVFLVMGERGKRRKIAWNRRYSDKATAINVARRSVLSHRVTCAAVFDADCNIVAHYYRRPDGTFEDCGAYYFAS